MALPAYKTPFGALLDVEAFLGQLPKERQAQLAWTKSQIETAINRLRRDELTDRLVEQTADAVLLPFKALQRAAWEDLVTRVAGNINFDDLTATMETELRAEERRLGTFVEDADSADTVSWVLGIMRAFLAHGAREEVRAGLSSLVSRPDTVEQVGQLFDLVPEMRSYVRGLVALAAASTEAKTGTNRERARDLLDIAFLQLNEFRTAMRRHGLWVSPHAETVEERRERLLQDATRLRASLSDDDWRVIDEAQLRNLRSS